MTTLASIINVASHVGYPVLILLVMAESGGVPLPGETAVITAGILASSGRLNIELVIVLAAVGAIVGDNIGYLIGRKGGRYLLVREGPFLKQRHQVLAVGEPFFERHGPKAVFFGRFIVGLRTWASWLAGATRMPWHKFVLWNALGGITWATAIGLLAYFLGHSVENAISKFGLWALVAVAVLGVAAFLLHRRHSRRRARAAAEATPALGGDGAVVPDAGKSAAEAGVPETADAGAPTPEAPEPDASEPDAGAGNGAGDAPVTMPPQTQRAPD